MKTYYFSFGQTHVHSVNGFTWDKDIICAIQSDTETNARGIMFDHFGEKWGFVYLKQPDLNYFPRGVKNLNF